MPKKQEVIPTENSTNVNFEDNLKRVEEILRLLENGELPLEEALALYDEGSEIMSKCKTQLNEARLRVEEIRIGNTEKVKKS